MNRKIKYFLISFFILAVAVAFIVLPGTAKTDVSEIVKRLDNKSAYDASYKEGNAKVEFVLRKLMNIYRNDGEDAAIRFASRNRLELDNGRIGVEVEVKPTVSFTASRFNHTGVNSTGDEGMDHAMMMAKNRVEQLGGIIEKTYNHYFQGKAEISTLDRLAELPEISIVRSPVRFFTEEVISEGVADTKAGSIQSLTPYRNKTPVKVCIIDGGFQNYTKLLGTELPSSVTVQAFTTSGKVENGQVHGTAVAEIIHDMAPDAELYFAVISTNADLVEAVDWAISQKVDLISFSMGNYWGPLDGTGITNSLAAEAKAAGITWICSAGNSGAEHWSGTFNDPDGNGWHNFSGSDEMFEFYVTAEESHYYGVSTILKWNDWGTWNESTWDYSGATQDYDLFLYILVDGEWYLVDSSENRQPGYKYPYEGIGYYEFDENTFWGVKIFKKSATQNVKFDMYIPTFTYGTLEYSTPEGSLTSPADSPNIISVGAIDAIQNTYHYYSSQGPTADGRIKPDICAPSGTSCSDYTYGSRGQGYGFYGTSASCPHMTGAIALLKSKTPFTTDEVVQILYGRVIDMGIAGADSKYGRGRLNMAKN